MHPTIWALLFLLDSHHFHILEFAIRPLKSNHAHPVSLQTPEVFARQSQNRLCSDLTNFKALVRAMGAFASLPGARLEADCLVPVVHFLMNNTITCFWSNTILLMIFSPGAPKAVCIISEQLSQRLIPLAQNMTLILGLYSFWVQQVPWRIPLASYWGCCCFSFFPLTFSDPCDDLNRLINNESHGYSQPWANYGVCVAAVADHKFSGVGILSV